MSAASSEPTPDWATISPAPTWTPPPVEELRKLLPQYEVLSMLGRGGMGAVYKGTQKSLDRSVAIKLLPSPAGHDPVGFPERFKNEARAMARLSHPGIVGVFEFNETGTGQLYFVMEYVDGTDLAARLRAQGSLPPAEAAAITAQVCTALEYAHTHGIVHRDIKPANILLDAQGHVKVADFGIARIENPGMRAALTVTGMAVGTADYAAPETLLAGKEIDGRADLYSVGVTLYQMLTGEVPRGLFEMPSRCGDRAIDPRFDDIVAKAMQTNPAARYQTAAEMRADLEATATPPRQSAASPSKSTHLRPIALAGVALLAVLGTGGYFLSRPGSSSQNTLPPSTPIASGAWIDGLAEWWARPGPDSSAGILTKVANGSLVRDRKGIYIRAGLPQPAFKDVALRVTVRDTSEYTSLYLRNTGFVEGAQRMKNYNAVLWRSGHTKVSLQGIDPAARDLLKLPPPDGFVPDGSHTFEFHAQGDVLTIFLDGRKLGSVQDSTLAEGKCYVTADPGTVIERLEYRDLRNGTATP